MYVPRSGSRCTGCVWPSESVARATRVCLPGTLGVFQLNSQSRQAFGFDSPSRFVSFQVDPPSVLSSTFVISPSLVQAAPWTRTLEFAGGLMIYTQLKLARASINAQISSLDLRDVQDVFDHAGFFHFHSVVVYRLYYRALFRLLRQAPRFHRGV